MDFQNRVVSKTGGGGVASQADIDRQRRERLRKLALETIDLNKDPYFLRNHLGRYECKLCLTLHVNEGSYLAHTQGKKHQENLIKRALNEGNDASAPLPPPVIPEKPKAKLKRFVKIGRPGYRVTKQYNSATEQWSLFFQVDYPQIAEAITPKYRFMSAYEQKQETPDRAWQYVIFAAEPYENVGFKIPSKEIDMDPSKFLTHWNADSKQYFLQLHFI